MQSFEDGLEAWVMHVMLGLDLFLFISNIWFLYQVLDFLGSTAGQDPAVF